MSNARTKEEVRFQGVGVSPGIARGRTHVVRDEVDDVARYGIESAQVPGEIARFESALMQTRGQILEMQQSIAESIGAKDASVFDAHLLVVEDRTLIDEVLRKLESDRCNVEYIFQEVARRYADTSEQDRRPVFARTRRRHSGRDATCDSESAGQSAQGVFGRERTAYFSGA